MAYKDEEKELDFYTLYVYNVPETYTRTSLKEVLEKYGRTNGFYCKMEGTSIKYAFYPYVDKTMAKNALTRFQNSEFDFKVKYANKNQQSNNKNVYKHNKRNNSYHSSDDDYNKSSTPKSWKDKTSPKNISNNENDWDFPVEKQTSKHEQNISTKKTDAICSKSNDFNNVLFEWFQDQAQKHMKSNFCICTKRDLNFNFAVKITENNRALLTHQLNQCQVCDKWYFCNDLENSESEQSHQSQKNFKYRAKQNLEKLMENDRNDHQNDNRKDFQEVDQRNKSTAMKHSPRTLKNDDNTSQKFNKSPQKKNFKEKRESVANNESFKSVFQHFKKGSQILVRLQSKTEDGSWLGFTISVDFNDQYNSLVDKFCVMCTETVGSSIRQPKSEECMLAVSINEEQRLSWYRALKISDKQYAMVDNGTYVSASDIVDIITCPKEFSRIPLFGCKLVLANVNHTLEKGDIRFSVVKIIKNTCVLESVTDSNITGSLHSWPHSDKKLQNESPNDKESKGTFSGNNCHSPNSVTIISKNTKENGNHEMMRNARPVSDYLEQNINDFPAITLDHIPLAKLDETTSDSNPNYLKVLDCSILKNQIISCSIYSKDSDSIFANLSERINDYCKKQTINHDYQPKDRDLCFAYYNKDKLWHRAFVVDVLQDSKYTLYLLDLGMILTIGSKDIKKMIPVFAKTPGFAVTCSLEGFPKNPSPDVIREAMKILKPGQKLKVTRVKKYDEYYEINIPSFIHELKRKNLC